MIQCKRCIVVFLWLYMYCISSSKCQRLSFGNCPTVEPMKDFDIEQFEGEWTEVERSFYLIESTVQCTKVNFTIDNGANETTTLRVDVSYKTPWRGSKSTTTYKANILESTPAIINMVLVSRLPSAISRLMPGSGKYTVLDTDYKEYALIYSCTNFRLLHADFVWILGRQMDITVNMRTKVYAALDKIGVNRDSLLLTPHKECGA